MLKFIYKSSLCLLSLYRGFLSEEWREQEKKESEGERDLYTNYTERTLFEKVLQETS